MEVPIKQTPVGVRKDITSQLALTYSTLTIETLEQGAKYVHS